MHGNLLVALAFGDERQDFAFAFAQFGDRLGVVGLHAVRDLDAVDRAALDRGRQAGFTDYVAKFDRDALLYTLQQTLSEQKGAA